MSGGNLWDTVVEGLSDPLFVIDSQGGVLRRNPAAARYSQTLVPTFLHRALLDAARKAVPLRQGGHRGAGPAAGSASGSGVVSVWRRILRRCEDESWIVMDVRALRPGVSVVRVAGPGAGRADTLAASRALEEAFGFSPAELAVVDRMVLAHCPRMIAAELALSVNTVRSHLRNIYAKLGVNTYAEAVRELLMLLR